jgi:RHS repeat-associated protein
VADETGTTEHLLDYYPYGSPRIDQATGFGEQRKYIGQYYDSSTDLSYLNARYYNGTHGQFLSQDPMFWSTKQDLQNPQSLNSYSYGNDNPITNSDPSGLASSYFSNLIQQAQQRAIQAAQTKLLSIYQQFIVGTFGNFGEGISNPIGSGQFAMDSSQPLPFRISAGIGLVAGMTSLGLDVEAQATRPVIGVTGKFGEQQLAKIVGGESQVSFPTNLGRRVSDQYASNIINEAKTGYQSLTSRNALQIAKDKIIVQSGNAAGAAWHFFESPVTGLKGGSAPLYKALKNAGIPFIIY